MTTPASSSTRICDAPATHGLPMPRATSAAWDALPPSAVRMPRAAWNPATSSASVNGAHEDHVLAAAARRIASAALSAIAPRAAPGEAAMPRVSVSYSKVGSKTG